MQNDFLLTPMDILDIILYISVTFIHSLVFSPKAGYGRNQSPVRRLVWLWHTAFQVVSQGYVAIAFPRLQTFPLSPLGASTCNRYDRPLSAKEGITGEKWPVNFACDFDFHVNPGFFDMPRKSATWETALLPPQGRHAVDFFARNCPKICLIITCPRNRRVR